MEKQMKMKNYNSKEIIKIFIAELIHFKMIHSLEELIIKVIIIHHNLKNQKVFILILSS